jgi:hypothetical protein
MRTSVLSALIGAGCLLMANADPAAAQATRTWVSGVGDDINSCSRIDPCKTFAGAISKTAAFGEINCVDPGGFGSVTITKSITIDCAGTFGSILAAGGNGINVNGTSLFVTIRNLSINGALTGNIGINFINGLSLHVENVHITGFTASSATGIRFAPATASATLHVLNSTITVNGIAPSTGGAIVLQPTPGGSAKVVIVDSKLENSAVGVAGHSASGGVAVAVRNTLISNNRSFGVLADGGGTTIRLESSTITGNVTGVGATGGGVLRSYKNNAINGNGADGTPIAQELLN